MIKENAADAEDAGSVNDSAGRLSKEENSSCGGDTPPIKHYYRHGRRIKKHQLQGDHSVDEDYYDTYEHQTAEPQSSLEPQSPPTHIDKNNDSSSDKQNLRIHQLKKQIEQLELEQRLKTMQQQMMQEE